MSSFNCPQCGTEIIDTPGGPYVTGCEHYPLESLNSENTKKALNNPADIVDKVLNLALDNQKKMAYPLELTKNKMNREIKFRAWANQMCKFSMFYFGLGDAYADDYRIYIACEDEGNPLKQARLGDKDCIIMQYTGIKDKNGKEIYEGDIVKIHETAYSLNDVQRQMRGGVGVYICEYVGVITWDNEGADYCCVQQGQTIEDSGSWPKHQQIHEVIGNIYENPELLNQKQA